MAMKIIEAFIERAVAVKVETGKLPRVLPMSRLEWDALKRELDRDLGPSQVAHGLTSHRSDANIAIGWMAQLHACGEFDDMPEEWFVRHADPGRKWARINGVYIFEPLDF